jgi:hypothetical protein
VAKDVEGTYGVEVDGLTGTFTVVKPPSPVKWLLVFLVIAVATLTMWAFLLRELLRYRRSKRGK